MELLDKDGKPVSSRDLHEEKTEQETEQTEREQPDFAPLVIDYNKKTKEILMDYFQRANIMNIQIDQNQAMQLANIVQDAMFNMIFSKLYDDGYRSIDEIIDEQHEEILKNLVSFEKNIETYNEDDLERLNQANKINNK